MVRAKMLHGEAKQAVAVHLYLDYREGGLNIGSNARHKDMSVARSSTVKEPRAHLEGHDLPADFKLPDLALVREEAAYVQELMRKPEPEAILGRNSQGQDVGILPTALIYNTILPNLFQFSYFCNVVDVPSDILLQCVWALEWFIRALKECSEDQLRSVGHILPNQQGEMADFARYFALSNARNKVAHHLLGPQIDRPIEALRHSREAVQTDEKRCVESTGISNVAKLNPVLYGNYAVSLARARTDDKEAKKALSRLVNESNLTTFSTATYNVIRGKVYLARVLRRLGETKQAGELETWLIKWFKKNPHKITDLMIVEMFTTDLDQETDPVLKGLGGVKWIEDRKHTQKTDERLYRACRNCHAREPQVKLAQCARCQHIYYCSKQCQKVNWPYHKEVCKEFAAHLKKIAELSRTAPLEAQRASDWHIWRDAPQKECTIHFASALELERDPSRGRTHIVLQMVEHVPNAKNVLDRFKPVAVGIFKLADIWQDFEVFMGLKPGEGKGLIDEVLEEFDHGPGNGLDGDVSIPVLCLMFSLFGEIDTYLSSHCVTMDHMKMARYNPEWRKALYPSAPPIHYELPSGVKEAEHIF
ncbi:uncharacterized protein EV420DRAFT_1636240 [Desarmillaria tabescens]|uniref:MYND-type domain-containing protein n=1 Tax=Armillaria tabescens TaxID=1929756 RepID=A0AA39NK89_ARMTA|nr:uncharacterized protein EV420DRAFT_1636240 [Desarmillaria tabescens]KAK0467212.1 hypothetical protein EV420DRAFT_1636240 [Desarmillaria tabescens]